MNIDQDTRPEAGRYYNADAYTEEQAINLPWWIVIIGDEDGFDSEEIDVWAPRASAAREVAQAAIERDYVPGISITRVVLA